ncbi:MAG: radical SAM protein [Candidatus Woesearchaeota archaeon]
MIKKTRYFSYANKSLPKGCSLCVHGRKTVIFVTGVCSESCYYCPISEQKYKKDVVYINEWPTKLTKNLLAEVNMCSSKGVGITGGDPLARLNRTTRYIRFLKKKSGKKFHIHLYTPLTMVNEKSLSKLYNAGLDEIRFHPNIEDDKLWKRITIAKKFRWDVGVEIPAVPGKEKETKKLIDFIIGKVDFLNINELEMSDTNAQHLLERGLVTKNRISYGVKGSDTLAKTLFLYAAKNGLKVHYCTAKLKDAVQLAKRLKLRSKKAKQKFDIVTKEGILVRGAVYGTTSREKVAKAVGYKKKGDNTMFIPDKQRRRVIGPVWLIYENRQKLKKSGLKPAIVHEYPTFDAFNVQTEFL